MSFDTRQKLIQISNVHFWIEKHLIIPVKIGMAYRSCNDCQFSRDITGKV